MTVAELRARIRALMASGELPSEAPSIERRDGEESARFALQDPALEPCAICGESRTLVALFFTAALLFFAAATMVLTVVALGAFRRIERRRSTSPRP